MFFVKLFIAFIINREYIDIMKYSVTFTLFCLLTFSYLDFFFEQLFLSLNRTNKQQLNKINDDKYLTNLSNQYKLPFGGGTYYEKLQIAPIRIEN